MAPKSKNAATSGGKSESETFVTAIINTVVDGIVTIDDQGSILTFNPSATRIFGYEVSEVVGQNVKMLMPEPYHDEHDSYISNYLRTGDAKIIGIGREVTGLRKDGSTFPLELSVSEMQVGSKTTFVGILRDVTTRHEDQKVIEAQRRSLLELSTPVVKLTEGVLLLPLIGMIDNERALQVVENLLEAIVTSEAPVAILDVTGVPVIDTSVAQHLLKTVSATRMLGAEIVLTGISSEIAVTLVKLSIDLSGIHTAGTLQDGITVALNMVGKRITELEG